MTPDANLRIVYKNAVDHDACVLTCTAVPTLPLDNLKNPKRARITRIPSASSFMIKGTYGGMGVYASMFSLIRHNLQPGATVRFKGYGTTDWAGATVADTNTFAAVDAATLGAVDFGVDQLGTSINDPFYGQQITTAWFTRCLILSWALEITDVDNTHGYIDASRLWIGDAFELAYNPSLGMELGWDEDTEQWPTDGGSLHADAGIPYRELSMDLGLVVESDRAVWMDIARYCGKRRDFFVSVAPEGTGEEIRDYSMQANFTTLPRLKSDQPTSNSTNIVIREA